MPVACFGAQYIKQQFAISKNQNTWIMEIQGAAAIFVMWVLFKPLIVNLGERRCVPNRCHSAGRQDKERRAAYGRVIVLGLAVNFSFFLGYLFIVNSMTWVYFFTVSPAITPW